MISFRRLVLVPLSATFALVACGGSGDSGLFVGGAGNTAGSSGAAGAAGSAGTNPGGSSGSGNGGSSGAGAGGTHPGTGGTAVGGVPGAGGAGSPDGGTSGSGGISGDGGASAGGTTGTGGVTATGGAGGGTTGATPGTVACTGGPCAGTCCHGALAGVECLPLICPSGGAPLQCDDRADCTGGKLCCGNLSKGSSCAAGPCNGEQFCRTNDECDSGKKCEPLGTDSRYSACK